MKRVFTLYGKMLASAALALGIALGAGSAQAAIIDLGFSLDESGSVGATNFNASRDALADALGLIPTSGSNQFRVAVTTFSTSTTTVVAPTILTAANLVSIQNAVKAATYSSGTTNTAAAISNLTSLFTGVGLGDISLFNITTDGQPNNQSAAQTAATAAAAAGIDGLSFEAVGNFSNTTLNNMALIAFPKPSVITSDITSLPDPLVTGFVLTVSSYDGYAAAIDAKIKRVIESTEVAAPGVGWLLLAGLGLIGLSRVRRATA